MQTNAIHKSSAVVQTDPTEESLMDLGKLSNHHTMTITSPITIGHVFGSVTLHFVACVFARFHMVALEGKTQKQKETTQNKNLQP